MTPITRKENYLNEIVGWGETAPEKPLTPEEFFFAAILGEAVQTPEPLSRYQIYLAKIAGRNISVPKPLTRLEVFLAKACGMDIETPTPITREEIFWSNYTAIVDFEVEGVPPLTYKAIEGTLENYRIYGDTVDGESVGDRTGNLFDKSGSQYGSNLHWTPTYSLVYSDTYYGSPIMDVTGLNTITRSYTGTGANYFSTSNLSQFVNVPNIGTVDAGVTVNVPDGYTKYVFNIPNTIRPDSIMVNSGSTALPYEPYGYKVPVTVEGKNLFSSRIEQGTFDITGAPNTNPTRVRSHEDDYIFLTPGVYKISAMGVEHFIVYVYDLPDVNAFNYNLSRTNWAPLPSTITINTSAYYKFAFCKTNNPIITPSDVSNIMLNTGSTALPYEPYHAPVTTPIYLPEPIKMVGDEAEYIDYAEQKQHRVRKNLWDETNGVVTDIWIRSDGIAAIGDNGDRFKCNRINVLPNITYTFSWGKKVLGTQNNTPYIRIAQYDSNGNFLSRLIVAADQQPNNRYTATAGSAASLWDIRIDDASSQRGQHLEEVMLNAGTDALPYEPYIENVDLDVTLPALPTIKGTNVLSVGTAVQPSKVYVKYKGERQ